MCYEQRGGLCEKMNRSYLESVSAQEREKEGCSTRRAKTNTVAP